MEALSSLEALLQVALGGAAVLAALFGVTRSLRSPAAGGLGEVVWSIVAVAVLAGVVAAVQFGGGRGV